MFYLDLLDKSFHSGIHCVKSVHSMAMYLKNNNDSQGHLCFGINSDLSMVDFCNSSCKECHVRLSGLKT